MPVTYLPLSHFSAFRWGGPEIRVSLHPLKGTVGVPLLDAGGAAVPDEDDQPPR